MDAANLRHRYIIMRHGFSVPNEARRIVSSVELGSRETFGLTSVGKQQAADSAALLVKALREESKSRPVVVLSSPFSRALQTAHIARATLIAGGVRVVGDVQVRLELRERYFGDLDGGSDENYGRVWAKDAADGDTQTSFGAESCLSVWQRVHSLVQTLEAVVKVPSTILLVSHGDTLQITQTALCPTVLPLAAHRSLKSLVQAEWRVVGGPAVLKSDGAAAASKL